MRDNQRRCRARKVEYVAELERKLQECQTAGARRDVETYQSIAQRLMEENKKLKELLNRAGVSKTHVEAYLGENSKKVTQEGSVASNEAQASSFILNSTPMALDIVR